MRAQQNRALGAPWHPREQIAGVRPNLRARVVLGHLEAKAAQLGRDTVRASALVAERRRNRAQLGEQIVQPPALDL
jgi:hypothetical protein